MPRYSDGPFCDVLFMRTRHGIQTYTFVVRGRAVVNDAHSLIDTIVCDVPSFRPTWRVQFT